MNSENLHCIQCRETFYGPHHLPDPSTYEPVETQGPGYPDLIVCGDCLPFRCKSCHDVKFSQQNDERGKRIPHPLNEQGFCQDCVDRRVRQARYDGSPFHGPLPAGVISQDLGDPDDYDISDALVGKPIRWRVDLGAPNPGIQEVADIRDYGNQFSMTLRTLSDGEAGKEYALDWWQMVKIHKIFTRWMENRKVDLSYLDNRDSDQADLA